MSDFESNEMQMVLVEINGQLVEKQALVRQNGFDPMTGQPVMVLQIQMGFDGMTGEPKYESIVQNGYHGGTGRPLYVIKGAANSQMFRAVTPAYTGYPAVKQAGNTTKPKKDSSSILKILIPVAAAVVVLAVVVVCLILSGVFISPSQKVLLATYNTIKDDTFGSAMLDMMEFSNAEEITSEYDVAVTDKYTKIKVNGTAAMDVGAKKMSVDARANISGLSQQVQAYYDDSVVRVAAPDLTDYVFEYDYTDENDGYIADLVRTETKGRIEDVNTLLSSFWGLYKNKSKFNNKLKKEMMDVVSDFSVEKIGSDKFEVNGKDRKCKGYRMTVNGRDIKSLMECYSDAMEEVYGDDLESVAEAVSNLTGENVSVSDITSSRGMSYSDIPDVDIDFYIYDNMLAALIVSVQGEEVEIYFEGGDTRTSRIVIEADNERFIKESEIDGSEESGSITAEGITVAEYSYDTKDGSLTVEPYNEDKIKAVVLIDKSKGITLEYDGEIDGSTSLDLSLSITKGARIQKPDGDVIDLGSLSERDIEQYINEISRQIMSFLY